MAIYHFSVKPLSRTVGRSSIAAAAYRSAVKLKNEREGIEHDYSRRDGVKHDEIVLPDKVKADWAKDRQRLWNVAEKSERRKDARTAREIVVAIPHELTSEQQRQLVADFARDIANGYSVAVDFSIHAPSPKGDERNVHAHLMMTTRHVTPEGLGDKSNLEKQNKWLLNNNLPTTQMQINGIRKGWEVFANDALALAGHDIRIDHRSHEERGLELLPTEKMGVHATAIERKGGIVSRARLDEEAAKRNAEIICDKPEQILTLIADQKSVFDKHDIARTLNRYLGHEIQDFQNALAAVMQSPALVELQKGVEGELSKFSTRHMVAIEKGLAARVMKMANNGGFAVREATVVRSIDRQNKQMQERVAVRLAEKVKRGEISVTSARDEVSKIRLTIEQEQAVRHILADSQVACVVGYAGAGKSTMLAAVREALEADGKRVYGAALSGKAAEGLQASSGIASRTLASWEMSWKNGNGYLQKGDVLVIDESGMLGSKQLDYFIGAAEQSGAKVVLVGDHEQLQPIQAGSAFKMAADHVGFVEMSDIRRQRQAWQREASQAFATGRTKEALRVYEERGRVFLQETTRDAQAAIVRDYITDMSERPKGIRVALAHRHVDVQAINAGIREALQQRGQLARGEESGEVTFKTNNGNRAFAKGDRIVFLENNKDLNIKNGMLGTVATVREGEIVAQLDGGERIFSLSAIKYGAFDHGYATTIHKSQGATVDKAFVLASKTMDRHMTYVAMTRHRDDVRLYAAKGQFKDMAILSETLERKGTKETTLDYLEKPQLHDEPRILIPATKEYVLTVDQVAAQNVTQHKSLNDEVKETQDFAARVFKDPERSMNKIQRSLEQGTSIETIQRVLQHEPGKIGKLHGKKGFLGENRERKEVIRNAKILSNMIKQNHELKLRLTAAAVETENSRRNRDEIEIPTLSKESQAILEQLDKVPYQERKEVIQAALATPQGQKAFAEAERTHKALVRRFGMSYHHKMGEHKGRIEQVAGIRIAPDKFHAIERIARQVSKAVNEKISYEYEQERAMSRQQERGISR